MDAGFFVVSFDGSVESAAGTNGVAAGKHHFFKDDDFLAAGFFCRDGSRKTGTASPNHDDVVGVIPIDSGSAAELKSVPKTPAAAAAAGAEPRNTRRESFVIFFSECEI